MSLTSHAQHSTTGFQVSKKLHSQQAANASSTRSESPPVWQSDDYRTPPSAGPSSAHDAIDTSSHLTSTAKPPSQAHIAPTREFERVEAYPHSGEGASTDELQSEDLDSWEERKLKGHQPELTVLDVAALILNKQIGTGIFTTPGAVLLTTQSKALSVALWTIGGFWTLMFLLIYLELGEAFPFNGGELVYLDKLYNKPQLLATILFSGYFVLLMNSYGNAIQFAKHVLVAISPKLQDSTELDSRLVQYIAISVNTLVCLIHYHSSKAGLFLNKLLAWYKVLLLGVVFVFGMVWSRTNQSEWGSTSNNSSTSDGMAGMVLIFYSYQGWENANYVAGEISTSNGKLKRSTLRYGALLGVTTTWVLYILVTVAFYRVLSYKDLTNSHSDLAITLHFAPKVFGSATGYKICMAISAFGNIVAVAYTASKVKQSIAVQRILPFWKFFEKDYKTPKGALVLHWITSAILIAAAPSSSDGYSFVVGIYTYGHVLVSALVAVGLYRLKDRARKDRDDPNWNLEFFNYKPLLVTLPLVFASGNVLILVFAGKVHKEASIPRWWWPIVTSIVLFVGTLYWTGIQVFASSTDGRFGLKVKIYQRNESDVPWKIQQGMDKAFSARLDGSGRRVVVETGGWLKSCGQVLQKFGKWVGSYLF